MRGSPPTRRVLQVLEVLGSQPTHRITNAEVAGSLGLSPSTTLGVLNELVDGGFAVRHRDRAYSLGGRAISLGVAARESRPALAVARKALRRLSGELGAVCSASAVVGQEIVVLEVEGPDDRSRTSALVRSGTRFPFLAPIGVMFAAWSDDAAVDRWLARSPLPLDDARVHRTREVIATCRRDGVLVERLTDAEVSLHQLLPVTHGHNGEDVRLAVAQALAVFGARDYVTSELEGGQHLSVSVVCAPTFDVDSSADLIVGAYIMRVDVDSAEIERITRLVRGAAEQVTAAVGGRDPWATA